MSLLTMLERRLSRLAIPNLTLYLVFGQSVTLAFLLAKPELAGKLLFVPAAVTAGEFWRIITFIFLPPTLNPVLAFFGLYFLYIMGTALETHWGTFRFNLYLLIAVVMTMGSAWCFPAVPASNAFIGGSVFLAFAYLYPDFQILLFFILPVRIKWLALITWVGYGWVMIFGPWSQRLLVLASAANFLLFFAGALLRRVRSGHRRMLSQASTLAKAGKPFHTCAACGITDKTDPKMEFRYCPDCVGTPGYCITHIQNHTHIQPTKAVQADGPGRSRSYR